MFMPQRDPHFNNANHNRSETADKLKELKTKYEKLDEKVEYLAFEVSCD